MPKEIHSILTETLGEHAPSCTTVKNWVAQFKRGDSSTCFARRPGRPKTVSTTEIMDQIHELNLDERRISAKSIAEQPKISHELVGSIIHEDLDMRKLSAKWVPKCLNADQKRHLCQSSEQLLEFFQRDPNDFLSRLVTMDETWLYRYDPKTKQQSLDCGIAAHTAPKNLSVKIHWKSSRLDFLGSRLHPPHLLSSKRPNYQHGVLLISAGAIEGYFEGKTQREFHQGGLNLARQYPGSLSTFNPEETGLPGLLDHPPYSPDLVRRTTTCSLD